MCAGKWKKSQIGRQLKAMDLQRGKLTDRQARQRLHGTRKGWFEWYSRRAQMKFEQASSGLRMGFN